MEEGTHALSRNRAAGALAALALFLSALIGLATPAHAAAEATTVKLTASPRSVTYGSRAGLHVYVASGSGTPLAGRTVAFDIRRGTTWGYVGAARTDARGMAVLVRTMTASGDFRARHVGDTRWAGSSSNAATILVTAAPLGAKVVNEASRHAGKPYQWGAVGPDRFDCSGFTMYVFSRFGKKLPHNSGQQYSVVRHVAQSQKQVGDLIFTHDNGRIHHVAIYAGDGYIWHSPHSGSVVNKKRMWSTSYYVGRVA